MNFLRLIYFFIMWFLIVVVTIIPHILGFILIPIACIFKAYVKTIDVSEKPKNKEKDGSTYHFTWALMMPWDNETDDGICCRNYYKSPFKQYGYLDMIVTTFMWSAVRNPINNFKRWISPKYNFNKLKHIGSKNYGYKVSYPCWYLIWQGPFAGYYKSLNLFGKFMYIKIGFKFRPYKDHYHVPESQKNGVGITFRIIPKVIR